MKNHHFGGKNHLLKKGLLAVLATFLSGTFLTTQAQTIDIGPNQYAFRYTNDPDFGLFFSLTNSQYEFRNGSADPVFAIGAGNGALKTDLTFAPGSDYLVGPDRYAFRYSNDPDFGLFFNNTNSQYEFRNGSAVPVMAINALNGQLKTDLQFDPSASYKVAPNNYAIRSAANANIGLYFGPSDYEFKNSAGTTVLNINANSGEIVSTSSITADGGTSSQWTQAFGWGDHAAEGYLTNESDPQVGAMTTSRVPRWSGTQLVNGSITDAGSGITVAGNSVFNNSLRVAGGINGSTSSSAFTVGSTTTYTALDNNEIQAYTGGAQGLLYLNFWGGDINFGSNTMWLDREDERIGINTSTPGAKLDVQGELTDTENLVNVLVNYDDSNVDIRGIRTESVTAPGYGYGIEAIGGWRGVYGVADASSYTATAYGVFGSASGTAGTRIGLYGSAFGGDVNWAVYSAGDTYVSGDLRVGNTSDVTGFRVSVDGKMICEELKVQNSLDWPDYVFADDYNLMDLNELGNYIETENHLPGIPSASEIEAAEGFEVGEMQRLTVEKLEELTLYILELKKENDELKKRIEQLEK